jgi:phosphate transport system substrate-binding protein
MTYPSRRNADLRFVSRGALFILAVAAITATARSQTQTPEQEALEIQRRRAASTTERGRKVHYTRRWDLGDLLAYQPQGTVSGTIRVWGLNYFTDGYLAKYWEEGFRKHHPRVTFEYFTPTALVAVPGLITGHADLGVTRTITWDERLTFQRVFGYHPLELTMVTGAFDVPGWAPALAIFVHEDNPISQLTMKQLDGVFGAERTGAWTQGAWDASRARGREGNIRVWGQLGLTGEWKDKPINVYGRTIKYQAEVLERLRGSDKWNETLREYAHDIAPDGSSLPHTATLIGDLGRDRYGIGYAVVNTTAPHLKAVALAARDGEPGVPPTIDTVRNRTYPLYSEEYFLLNRKPGQPIDPKVKEYVRYALSREGQAEVMRDGKFLPLTGDIVREQLKKLD